MKKLLFLGAFMAFISAQAQDRVFTYTYQSNVLNKGQKELEVWTTLGTGRQDYYRGLNHRLEFEIGLGSKLQTAFYLNYGYSASENVGNSLDRLSFNNSYSFANEWKLKLSDPVANKLGSALYFEYTLAPAETELEGKLILDKQTGKFIHALNLVGELELEKEFAADENKFENEAEVKLEWNYGLSYKLRDNWFAGLEVMNSNVLKEGELEKSILSAGPGVAYVGKGFWINFTLMPQLTNLKGGGRSIVEDDGLQSRLLFSYEF
ncbi:MAG TPA: hypothetical protein VK205_02095 [Prolixibacteraceae bacterium]|nr:hypothetical protein [Prolixibacteraceae bacterium]